MLNKEFQKLKGEWSNANSLKCELEKKMRENLKERNGGKNEYKFGYTIPGKVLNIDTCIAPGELFEIDGDMNPRSN